MCQTTWENMTVSFGRLSARLSKDQYHYSRWSFADFTLIHILKSRIYPSFVNLFMSAMFISKHSYTRLLLYGKSTFVWSAVWSINYVTFQFPLRTFSENYLLSLRNYNNKSLSNMACTFSRFTRLCDFPYPIHDLTTIRCPVSNLTRNEFPSLDWC